MLSSTRKFCFTFPFKILLCGNLTNETGLVKTYFSFLCDKVLLLTKTLLRPETARAGYFVVVVKLKLSLLRVAVDALCHGCVVFTFTWPW